MRDGDREPFDRSDLTTDVWSVSPSDLPDGASDAERSRYLLRWAVLAPSSHNSQPWAFRVDGPAIRIRADRDRLLPVADRDCRELHLSLGCAVENLVTAAQAMGFGAEVTLTTEEEAADDEGVAVVTVRPADAGHVGTDASPDAGTEASPDNGTDASPDTGTNTSTDTGTDPGSPVRDPRLLDALRDRRTSHHAFRDHPVPQAFADRLRARAAERDPGPDIDLLLIDDEATKEAVAELQNRADRSQMSDPDYREELGRWLGSGALGDGWPMARVAQWVVTHFDLGPREGQQNGKLIRDAPLLGVIVAEGSERRLRIRCGRLYERCALEATAEGIATHPLSQILEVPELRGELRRLLDPDRIPQHLFRIGYPTEPSEPTPRLPMERFAEES